MRAVNVSSRRCSLDGFAHYEAMKQALLGVRFFINLGTQVKGVPYVGCAVEGTGHPRAEAAAFLPRAEAGDAVASTPQANEG